MQSPLSRLFDVKVLLHTGVIELCRV